MPTIRHDERQIDLDQKVHYQSSWLPDLVLTWNEAHRLIENVCVAMTQAGYRADDVTRMRTSLEEGIFHILEREQVLGRAQPVQASFRVNQLQVVVEIQTHGSPETGDQPAGTRPNPLVVHSFMTAIRYSRQDHAATVCDCQRIE